MAQLVGQTLGNYRIEERLGTGGMGEVYRAVHLRLKRTVAIKVMHAALASDDTFQARFLREAQSAAALSHPNIVEVYDFGEQDGSSYLVMELVPDGSLRTLLRQRASGRGWSLELGLDLVCQVAEGLAYAHARGMVHRDIKPDNLLLERLSDPGGPLDTERYRVKISDFGLARMAEAGGDLTTTGVVMGTPAYMSPEQCQGEALDGRSDLYSLGVVLYEVATGSPPFRVRSLSEAVFKHISAVPPNPRDARPDLPLALDAVILRCLAKRPEDRYATGGELVQALRGAVSDSEYATVITPPPAITPPATTPPAVPMSTSRPAAAAPTSGANQTPPSPAMRAESSPVEPEILAVPSPAPGSDPAAVFDEPTIASTTPATVSTIGQSLASASGVFRARVTSSLTEMRSAVSTVAASGISRVRAYDLPTEMTSLVTGTTARVKTQAKRYPAWTFGAVGGGALVIVLAVVLAVATRRPTHSLPVATVARKTPTATVAPVATSTPVETVRYQDALTANNRRWPVVSHCQYANGGYEVTGSFFCYAPPGPLGDATISVRARQVAGPTDQFYGILLRGVSDSHYYFFGVNAQGQWTFSLADNGASNAIVAPRTDSHVNGGLNASNTLTVRARGSHFTFYVNGAQVGQADDGSLATGQIALINPTGHISVVYNDYLVTVPS